MAENNKKRFEYDEDGLRIRASQGHSIKVDLGYEEKTPPDTLYHGTSLSVVGAILDDGLKKMGRHHVHLSADEDTALVVAKRRPRPVIFKVNAKEMVAAGYKFYQSTNGVWLTDVVPPIFLKLD